MTASSTAFSAFDDAIAPSRYLGCPYQGGQACHQPAHLTEPRPAAGCRWRPKLLPPAVASAASGGPAAPVPAKEALARPGLHPGTLLSEVRCRVAGSEARRKQIAGAVPCTAAVGSSEQCRAIAAAPRACSRVARCRCGAQGWACLSWRGGCGSDGSPASQAMLPRKERALRQRTPVRLRACAAALSLQGQLLAPQRRTVTLNRLNAAAGLRFCPLHKP